MDQATENSIMAKQVIGSKKETTLSLISGVYSCDTCSLQTCDRSTFQDHLKGHKFDHLYLCHYCTTLSSTTKCIMAHISKEHQGKQPYFTSLVLPSAERIINSLGGNNNTSQIGVADAFSLNTENPSAHSSNNVLNKPVSDTTKLASVGRLEKIIDNVIAASLAQKESEIQDPGVNEKANKSKDQDQNDNPNLTPKAAEPQYSQVNLSDDSDVEITGESRIPSANSRASKAAPSSKPSQPECYETKLQCAYSDGRYVCKSCKLGSTDSEQFGNHIYAHLHTKKNGFHSCPYCPQDSDKPRPASSCTLVKQLQSILEKQKKAQQMPRQSPPNLKGLGTFVNDMGSVSHSETRAPEVSVSPSQRQNTTNSAGPSGLFPVEVPYMPDRGTVKAVPSQASSLPTRHHQKPSPSVFLPVAPYTNAQATPTQLQEPIISPIVIQPIVIEPTDTDQPNLCPVQINTTGTVGGYQTNTAAPGGTIAQASVAQTRVSNINPTIIAPNDRVSPKMKIKSEIKTENEQKPQGKSIVRCYHEDDKFVCERCKYSVHHSKAKVFRKHLWFEVHPTRTCNHSPESNQYNRFKSCPIINQLMLHLLDAKMKKDKKVQEETVTPPKVPEDLRNVSSSAPKEPLNNERSMEITNTGMKNNEIGSVIQTSLPQESQSFSESSSSNSSEVDVNSVRQGSENTGTIEKPTRTQAESTLKDGVTMTQKLDERLVSVGDSIETNVIRISPSTSAIPDGTVARQEGNMPMPKITENVAATEGNSTSGSAHTNITQGVTPGALEAEKVNVAMETSTVDPDKIGRVANVEGTKGGSVTTGNVDNLAADNMTLCISNVVSQAADNEQPPGSEAETKGNNMQSPHIVSIVRNIAYDVQNQSSKSRIPNLADEVRVQEGVPDSPGRQDENAPKTNDVNRAERNTNNVGLTVEASGTNAAHDDRDGPDRNTTESSSNVAEENTGAEPSRDSISLCITNVVSQADGKVQGNWDNEKLSSSNTFSRDDVAHKKDLPPVQVGQNNSDMEGNADNLDDIVAIDDHEAAPGQVTNGVNTSGRKQDNVQLKIGNISGAVDKLTRRKEVDAPYTPDRPATRKITELVNRVEARRENVPRKKTLTNDKSNTISSQPGQALSEKVTSEKLYVCAFYKCAYWVAKDAGSFKIHNLLHHQNAKSLPCAFCNETFDKEEDLVLHMDCCHTESKLVVFFRTYNCGFKDCWLGVRKSADFVEHNQGCHSNVKSYPCCYCKNEFRTMAELIVHIDQSVKYSSTISGDAQMSTYANMKKHILKSSRGKELPPEEVDSVIQLRVVCAYQNETSLWPKYVDRFVSRSTPSTHQETFKCTNCALVSSDEVAFEAHVVQCAKKGPNRNKISQLLSARPVALSRTDKDKGKPASPSTQKETGEGPRLDTGQERAAVTPVGNNSSGGNEKSQQQGQNVENQVVQHVNSAKISRRKTQPEERQWEGNNMEYVGNSTGASREKLKALRKERISPSVIVIDDTNDNAPVDDSSQSSVQSLDDTPKTSKKDERESIGGNVQKPSGLEITTIGNEDSAVVLLEEEDEAPKAPIPPIPPPSPSPKKGVLLSLGQGCPVACDKCSFTTEFRVIEAIHKRIHRHPQDKTRALWCPHCPYSTDVLLHFKIHSQCHTEKRKIRLYHCGYCPRLSNKMDLIEDHLEAEHGEEELKSEVTRLVPDDLQCTICNHSVKTEVDLLKHIEEMHGLDSFQKYVKEMYNIASLQIVDENAKEQEEANEKTQSIQKPDPATDVMEKMVEDAQLDLNRFQCPSCAYSYHRFGTWVKHLKRNHISTTEKYVLYSCKVCQWKSTSKDKTVEHCKLKHNTISMLVHTMGFAEIEAEAETDSVKSGERDMPDTDEQAVAEHRCDFCNFSTTVKDELVQHWACHEGQTLSSTLDDGDEAASGGEYEESEGYEGISGEQRKEPHYSKDTLRLIEDIILNLRHDTGHYKQDRSCPLCPFLSGNKTYMLKHLIFHKNQTYLKNGFKCVYCFYITASEGVLTKHINRYHPNLPLKKKVIGNAQLKNSSELATEEVMPFPVGGEAVPIEVTPKVQDLQDAILEESLDQKPVKVHYIAPIDMPPAERDWASSAETATGIPTPKTRPRVDDKVIGYNEETIRLIDDMIMNLKYSGKRTTSSQLSCPICPFNSDRFSMNRHLISHKNQAYIKDGYRCGYCLYSSEKKYSVSRHLNRYHQYLLPKKIKLGNPKPHRTKSKPAEVYCPTKESSCTVSIAPVQDETSIVDVINSSGDENNSTFTISAVSGSDGSTVRMHSDTAQPAEGKLTTSPKGRHTAVSPEMEKYCRSLYCTKDEQMNLFRCKNCAFVNVDIDRVYHHFCSSHWDECRFQCGYCRFRSVAVVKIQQHCEYEHCGRTVKVSPVIRDLGADNQRTSSAGHTEDKDTLTNSQSATNDDGLSVFMIDCGSDIHMCNICGFEDTGRIALKRHVMDNHLKFFPYRCRHCEFASPDEGQALKHTEKSHPSLDPTIIRKNVREELEEGLLEDICDGDIGRPEDEATGSAVTKGDGAPRANKRCALCPYSTKWQISDVKVHVLVRHLGLQPFSCRYCSFGHRTRTMLARHYYSKHRGMDGNPDEDWRAVNSALTATHVGNITYISIAKNADEITKRYGCKVKSTRGHGITYGTEKINEPRKVDLSGPDRTPNPSSAEANSVMRFNSSSSGELQTADTPAMKMLPDETSDYSLASQSAEGQGKKTIYKCGFCGSRYLKKLNAMNHIVIKHGRIKPYMCRQCNYGSNRRVDVENHMHAEHPACAAEPLAAYKEHASVIDGLQTMKVNYAEFRSLMKEERKKVFRIEWKGFRCCYCDEYAATLTRMQKHYDLYHAEQEPRYIKVKPSMNPGNSGSHYPTPTPFMRPKERKIGFADIGKKRSVARQSYIGKPGILPKIRGPRVRPKTFKCNYCEYTTAGSSFIKTHVMRHLSYKPFGCPFCRYNSVSRKAVDRHLRRMHRDPNAHPEKIIDPQIEATVSEHYHRIIGAHQKGSSFSSQMVSQPVPTGSVDVSFLKRVAQSAAPSPPAKKLRVGEDGSSVDLIDLSQEGSPEGEPEVANRSSTPVASDPDLRQDTTQEGESLPWICPHCEFRASTENSLMVHCRRSHPSPDDISYAEESPAKRLRVDEKAELPEQEVEVEDVLEAKVQSTHDEQIDSSKPHWSPEEEPSEATVLGRYDGIPVNDKQLVKDTSGMFYCQSCDFSSADREKAVGHYARNHIPSRFKCPYCDFRNSISFVTGRHVRCRHPREKFRVINLEADHPSTPSSNPSTQTDVNKDNTSAGPSEKPSPVSKKDLKLRPTNIPSVFCCFLCTFKTNSTLDLIEHQRKHADGEKTATPSEPSLSDTISMESDPSASDIDDITRPEGLADVRLKCPHCAFVAKDREELQKHGHEKHTFLRPFKCGYCDFSGFVAAKVKGHCRRKHPGSPLIVADQRGQLESILSRNTLKKSPHKPGTNRGAADKDSVSIVADNILHISPPKLEKILRANQVKTVHW